VYDFTPEIIGLDCHGLDCRLHFVLRPQMPGCSLGRLIVPPGALQVDAAGGLWCTITAPAADRILATLVAHCLEPASILARQAQQCQRVEPIGLPVAGARRRAPLRGGFEFALGWHRGRTDLDAVAVSFSVTLDWLRGERLAIGPRIAHTAVATSARPGDADLGRASPDTLAGASAWETGARLRLELRSRPSAASPPVPFVEAGTGYRFSAGESNHFYAAAGAGLSGHIFGLGLRYLRPLGGDAAATDALFVTTDLRTVATEPGPDRERRPGVGLGMHLLGAGWGFASHQGIMPLGMAVEIPFYLGPPALMPLLRWDLLWFPGLGGPAMAAHTVTAHLLWLQLGEEGVLAAGQWRLDAGAGYTVSAGDRPRAASSGPVIDLGLSRAMDGQGWELGLHSRWGVPSGEEALRAVFLSLGGRQIF
jgi:hypothetical protein